MKDEIRCFLHEELKLQLSEEKTLITHATTEKATFLGCELRIRRSRTGEALVGMVARPSIRFRRRITGYWPQIQAPVQRLIGKLNQKGFCDKDGFPTSKAGWIGLDADQIVSLFNSSLHGLLNYYRMVDNFRAMSRIQYILRFSLAKTLAHKYKVSTAAIFRKHGRDLHFRWEIKDGRTGEISFRANADWKVDREAFAVKPLDPDKLLRQLKLKTRSKLGFPCLICGATENVEMHHVRHLRKMRAKKPTGFTAVMASLNRKQVPVCRPCHDKIHRGEYDGISMQDLAYDFVAELV